MWLLLLGCSRGDDCQRSSAVEPVQLGRMARARMMADPGPGDAALTLSRSELAEAWGIGE
jgi:hypothetical protein